MKQHAARVSHNAEWNIHTMLNAVPQRQNMNAGIWLDLEKMTAKWADNYGKVWIVAGPVFTSGEPKAWLGEDGEMLIVIPDAMFKAIVKMSGNQPDVLAFIYPQEGEGLKKGPFNHSKFMVSVDEIEKLTGLDFLTVLPDAEEGLVEKVRAKVLWPEK